MLKLNFPVFEFKLKNIDSKTFIFDFIRKNYYLLTPEEWVRQHILHFLKSKYLMISNGLDHLYFKIDQVNKTHIFVKDFPL